MNRLQVKTQMYETTLNSNEWFKVLKNTAVHEFGYTRRAARSFDKGAWLEYWYEDFSPFEALVEDHFYSV